MTADFRVIDSPDGRQWLVRGESVSEREYLARYLDAADPEHPDPLWAYPECPVCDCLHGEHDEGEHREFRLELVGISALVLVVTAAGAVAVWWAPVPLVLRGLASALLSYVAALMATTAHMALTPPDSSVLR